MTKGRKTGGRRKGTPNRVTKKTREMLSTLVDENLPLANEWLKGAWQEKPADAAAFFKALIEFAAPRFARVDPIAEKAAEEAANQRSPDDLSDAELMAIAGNYDNPAVAAADLYHRLISDVGDSMAAAALERLPAAFPAPTPIVQATAVTDATPARAPAAMARPVAPAAEVEPVDEPPPKTPPTRPGPLVGDDDFYPDKVIVVEGGTLIPREEAIGLKPRRRPLVDVTPPRQPKPPLREIALSPGANQVEYPDGHAETVTIEGDFPQSWAPPAPGRYVVNGLLQMVGYRGGFSGIEAAVD